MSFIDPLGLDPVPAPEDEAKADPTWFERASKNYTFLQSANRPALKGEVVGQIGFVVGAVSSLWESVNGLAQLGNPIEQAKLAYNLVALSVSKEKQAEFGMAVASLGKTIANDLTGEDDYRRGRALGNIGEFLAELAVPVGVAGKAGKTGSTIEKTAVKAEQVVVKTEVKALPKAAKVEVAVSESAAVNIEKLAESHITNSGITVLGHYDPITGGYIEKAKKIGASYFDLGDVYNTLPTEQSKAANFHFLDVITKRGDKIILSVPKQYIRKGSPLEDEINYLTGQKGYKFVNQWSLKKVK